MMYLNIYRKVRGVDEGNVPDVSCEGISTENFREHANK